MSRAIKRKSSMLWQTAYGIEMSLSNAPDQKRAGLRGLNRHYPLPSSASGCYAVIGPHGNSGSPSSPRKELCLSRASAIACSSELSSELTACKSISSPTVAVLM